MSDDRLARARAEAERRYPEGWDHYNDEPVDDWGESVYQREGFRAGVEWADANPQPRTITREQHARLVDTLVGGTVGGEGVITHLDSLDSEGIIEGLLRDLGIEVTDDAG